ncbi:MAG: pdp, partial [Bacteroidetes bacterium]|nr:pdp [Bacteroidota bacterium]
RRQGGDVTYLETPEKYGDARHRVDARAPRDGWVSGIPARAIGELATDLGAGRRKQGDVIDPRAGIVMGARIGDRVQRGDLLATVHASDGDAALAAARRLQTLCAIGDSAVVPAPRIAGVVDEGGRLPAGDLR